MSKSTFGWRQAGFAGVAAALVAGGALIGVSTANAAATTLTVPAPQVKTPIAAGTANQPVADLNYTFDNSYATGSSVAFTIAGNNCSTIALKNKAIGFSAAPAAKASTVAPGTSTAPTITPAAGTLSSSPGCAVYGIQDIFTVDIPVASSGTATDRINIALTGIKYTTGVDAAAGDVTVAASGTLGGAATAINAKVVDVAFGVTGFTAVKPGATATVGATITESRAGAQFPVGVQTVTLDLTNGNGANINASPLPTATMSGTGHTVGTVTVVANKISIPVTTGAGASATTLTVSGISITTSGITQATLTSNAGEPAVAKALNVMNFTERVGGHNRYDTAAKLFNNGPGNNDNQAVLVNGTDAAFPDALSASYLADNYGTGILLTEAATLPQETKNALQSNGVKEVYVVGGPLVVSDAVVAQLRAMTVNGKRDTANLIVTRVSGRTRYATNKAVNETAGLNGDTALVATGNVFPDALALSPISYNESMPLILTDGSSLSPEASDQLDSMSPNNAVIAGGPNAVSTGVETAIDNKSGVTTYRVAGGNRTETAAVIAEWATTGVLKSDGTPVSGYLGTSLGFSENATNIATGASPADALAAGPYAGWNNEVILLSNDATSIGTGIVTYLSKKQVANVRNLVGFGLQLAVNNSVLKGAAVATQK